MHSAFLYFEIHLTQFNIGEEKLISPSFLSLLILNHVAGLSVIPSIVVVDHHDINPSINQ